MLFALRIAASASTVAKGYGGQYERFTEGSQARLRLTEQPNVFGLRSSCGLTGVQLVALLCRAQALAAADPGQPKNMVQGSFTPHTSFTFGQGCDYPG
jgi:hypothetical protein